jgi:integrase
LLYCALVEGDAVAIYRLLQNSAFGPEDIERLSAAYEEALRLLELLDRTDAATQIIARRIIQAAQSGAREPSEICRLAIKDLRVP